MLCFASVITQKMNPISGIHYFEPWDLKGTIRPVQKIEKFASEIQLQWFPIRLTLYMTEKKYQTIWTMLRVSALGLNFWPLRAISTF